MSGTCRVDIVEIQCYFLLLYFFLLDLPAYSPSDTVLNVCEYCYDKLNISHGRYVQNSFFMSLIVTIKCSCEQKSFKMLLSISVIILV